jgi:putative sterol carrier protein
MTDTTAEFFNGLDARGYEPMLENVTGTVRFDLTNGRRRSRWFVEIDKGDVVVSHRNARADCVVRADKRLFDRIAGGEANPMAAVLRGEIEIEGRRELLVFFQRLFPGPPRKGS